MVEERSLTEAWFRNTELWKKSYQRNNKQSGVKNLRCFPYCDSPHRKHGFCGRPVTLSVKCEESHTKLHAWAEFCSVQKYRDDSLAYLGKSLGDEEIDAKVRTREQPLLPWYSGMVSLEPDGSSAPSAIKGLCGGGETGKADKIVRVQIKSQKTGWNYTYVANRHTTNTPHCFVVYLFKKEEADENRYICIGVHKSPEFTVYCKRRPLVTVPKEQELAKYNEMARLHAELYSQAQPQNVNSNDKEEHSNVTSIAIGDEPETEVYNKLEEETYKMLKNMSEATDDVFPLRVARDTSQTSNADNDDFAENEGDMLTPTSTSDAVDYIFMKTLEQFSYDEEMLVNSSNPNRPLKAERYTGRKRGGREGEVTNSNTLSVDYGKIPTNLERPFPLKSIQGDEAELDLNDFEIPFDILPLFGFHDDNNPEEYAVRKNLWRLCVILTILDSHWRTFEELYRSDKEKKTFTETRSSRSNSFPEEYPYSDRSIKTAFLEVAKVISTLEYQREMYDNLKATKTLGDKEKAYVFTSMKYITGAVNKANISLVNFLRLFPLSLPDEAIEPAKQRLRCVNAFIRQFKGDDAHDTSAQVEGKRGQEVNFVKNTSPLRVRIETEGEDENANGSVKDSEYKVQNIARRNLVRYSPEGIWHYDDSVLDALDHIRSKYLRMNYVLRKLYRFMEQQIKIDIIDDDILRLSTRPAFMMGSFCFNYKLDGRIHKYAEENINLPIGRSNALVYAAYWNEDSVIMETYFDVDQSRKLVREYTSLRDNYTNEVNPEASRVTVSFAELDKDTNEWITLYEDIGYSHKNNYWN